MMKIRRLVIPIAILGCLITGIVFSQLAKGTNAGQNQQAKIAQERRQQPGTDTQTYSPKMHQLYKGDFHLTASRIYMIGGLFDKTGWDHIDNEAKNVRPVPGNVTIDVDEIKNTGRFVAKCKLPEGDFEMVFDRFVEFKQCQDGGIASWIYEHGDSGCGDANWPKTLIYLAGWGHADAYLNGEILYKDYQAHFMVTQGMRDRETLKVHYPVLNKKTPAGQVDPATIQVDFYIRSKEADPTNTNNPPKKTFAHFFGMEITWK